MIDSFELPSYWFNPPALLFLAAACNQLRHLEGGSFGGLAEKIENLLRLHHYMGSWYLADYCHQRREARIFHAGRIVE